MTEPDMTTVDMATVDMATVDMAYDDRDNSMNFLRLACALVILLVHAWALGGYGVVRVGGKDPGALAVDGFFAISGFLLTRSWLRPGGTARFAWRRFLRIMPAFWLCLLLIAGVFAPLGWWYTHGSLRGYLSASPHGPVRYVLANITPRMSFYDVAGTPSGVPFPPRGSSIPVAWNASLWTLWWEILCYGGVVVLGLTGVIPRGRRLLIAGTAACWLVLVAHSVVPTVAAGTLDNDTVATALRFGPVFASGASLALFGDRVRLSGPWAALAAAGVCGSFLLAEPLLLIIPCLAYLLLWLAVHLPCRRIGARNDLSYGVYIYAFPLQQLLAIYGFQRNGFPAYLAVCAAGTFAIAFASWRLVERPALGWKDRRVGVRRRSGIRRRGVPVPPAIPRQEPRAHVADRRG